MKTVTILLVVMLAIAGPAFAQSDTSATTAAEGTYPAGTTFNGVAISGIDIGTGALVSTDGTAEGHVAIALLGPVNPLTGTQQIITIEADASGGSRAAANVTTLTGTCSIDMGDGTPALSGVPIVATISTDANNLGSVGLTIGATALPTAAINAGSMSIADLSQ